MEAKLFINSNDKASVVVSACLKLLDVSSGINQSCKPQDNIAEIFHRASLVMSLMSYTVQFPFQSSLADGSFCSEVGLCGKIAETIPLCTEDVFRLLNKFLDRNDNAAVKKLLDRFLKRISESGVEVTQKQAVILFRMRSLFEPADSLCNLFAGIRITPDKPDSVIYFQLLRWLELCAGQRQTTTGEMIVDENLTNVFEIQEAISDVNVSRVQQAADMLLARIAVPGMDPALWFFAPFSDVILFLHCFAEKQSAIDLLLRVRKTYASDPAALCIFNAIKNFCLETSDSDGFIFLDAAAACRSAWQTPYRNWFVLLAAQAFTRSKNNETANNIMNALPFMACAPFAEEKLVRTDTLTHAAASSLLPVCRNIVLWDAILGRTIQQC